MAELRLIRQSVQKLEVRVETLESLDAASRARTESKERAPNDVPELTVVKVKPKVEPAPKIPVAVRVVEPNPEAVDGLLDAPAAPSNDDDLEQVSDEIDLALTQIEMGDLQNAARSLAKIAEENPRHPRADNALYHCGVALMKQSDHESAVRIFDRLIEKYPAGDATLEGMLRLGESLLKLKRTDRARALLSKLVNSYPGTAAANLAEQRLAQLGQ